MMEETTKPTFSKGYRRYVLFVLTGVYMFNFIDRQILNIIQEGIKTDLGLSDTQLGSLTGLAFALFYVTLGLPIARYADRSNRKNIVSVALAVWSAMTAVCGLAQNFVQLALARIGVGIGEAGGSPPAHAIISDYYPPGEKSNGLVHLLNGDLYWSLCGISHGWDYSREIRMANGTLCSWNSRYSLCNTCIFHCKRAT